jgi:MraZ protein
MRFRDVLTKSDENSLMVTTWQRCLKAFPVQTWLEMENKLYAQGKEQPGLASFVRYVVSAVQECTLDKQNRILLPKSLCAELNINREVILNGMLDHFEIWDKKAWDLETRQTRENFSKFEESLATLGIF